MKEPKYIQTPLDAKTIRSLEAGDEVLLSGTIYTGRDQVHMRVTELMGKNETLPVDLSGQIIYYCGPAPAGDRIIGSCGPTTSGRMDAFTPALLKAGLKGMIGKGRRSGEVVQAVRDNCAVYLLAPGGAGAYLSSKVVSCEPVAFEDLGPEAIYRMEVKDFPLVVGIDCKGRDIYKGMD